MIPTRTWELGSHFDEGSPSWRGDSDSGLGSLPLLESGRQALALTSKRLKDHGFSQLIFPTHHCSSMVTPFLSDGWRICWARVTHDWRILPPSVDLTHPEKSLIYSVSFFGVPESPTWLTWLDEQRRRGARILSDETHRVGGPWLLSAHHHVASLRKMLPVPDGAVLTGLGLSTKPPGTQGEHRWEAMTLKRRQLGSEKPTSYLEAFARAEAITERDLVPARASDRTRTLLGKLAVVDMLTARSVNARALATALTGTSIRVTTVSASVPSHVVLEHDRAAELRRFLVARRIFAPVHWPAGPVAVPGGWRGRILSIPVDHRYTPDDMMRVADTIRRFDRGGA